MIHPLNKFRAFLNSFLFFLSLLFEEVKEIVSIYQGNVLVSSLCDCSSISNIVVELLTREELKKRETRVKKRKDKKNKRLSK